MLSTYGVIAALVVLLGAGIAYIAHLPRKPDDFDQLDAQRVNMETEQATKEDGWIDDAERKLSDLRVQLGHLRAVAPRTLETIHKTAQIHSAIIEAEAFLATLRQRKAPFPGDRRQSAAAHYEGRM